MSVNRAKSRSAPARSARAPAPGSSFAHWAAGTGVIRHVPETQRRLRAFQRSLKSTGDGVPFWELLAAADRLANAAMWLVVHDTYAKRVYLDGRPLQREDFKDKPEGHTGGSLNIVPAYVGYLLANALSGHTRGWIAEQGHTVSGFDGTNVLVGNVTEAHAHYTLDDDGLTRFVSDFYAYRVAPGGRPESPRGSHVNAHTAGGIAEGGYLGFAGLQYVHLPLKGERLVAFLSDGAFEEQRGSDWAPRWWRRSDCGMAVPVMIANGRRIDQRTTTTQQGGTHWLQRHLILNNFDPIVVDGRDPAAVAWGILESERRLERAKGPVVKLPYVISVTVKGYGFPGAGTNAAHNLPIGSKVDDRLIDQFRRGAAKLHVPEAELRQAVSCFQRHRRRPREKDHPMAHRDVKLRRRVEPAFVEPGTTASPMEAIDDLFVHTCAANRHLRPRVGNPDEMTSNRLIRTLARLKHRVTSPEPGVDEAIDGAVITALNEEAVVSAALANKGGINLVHTYEAFGVKMLGALRQEILFAAHCMDAGREQRWLSIPIVLTSHTYENGKNEQSHQDPALCEALMGEAAHVSRVVFPCDANSAAAALEDTFATRGQIWTLVVPKRELPVVFTAEDARRLVREGGLVLRSARDPEVLLTAVGAYQLQETLTASRRLAERGVNHQVIYLLEPRRFAEPKDAREAVMAADRRLRDAMFPEKCLPRLFVTHTRAGRIQGLLQVIDTGPRTLALGYRNHGGTYDVPGMMFANEQSWAHVLDGVARVVSMPRENLLDEAERAALDGKVSPHGIVF